MSNITPIVMPKWGLEMREGTVAAWLVGDGARIEVGTPILDVETDKISNAVEAPDPGLLRRRVAKEGETLPVKALLGVLAEADVSDEEVDAFVQAFEVPAADADDVDAQPAYRYADVEGLRIRYARRGPDAGVPVVFLHGFGGDLNNWLFNLDAAAAHRPAIALDLPGHGESTIRLPADGDLPSLARFVAAFLETLGIERAHLVGHSMGGAIAAQLALDAPKRVVSLALVNSAGLGAEIDAAYLDGFVAAASRRELKPVVEKLFADPAMVSRALVEDLLKYKRLDGVEPLLASLAARLFGGGRQASTPGLALAEADLAVLVVWGAEDRIIPAAHARHAPPRAGVHVLDGAGHMVMLEKAAEFNALLQRHLGG